MSPNEAMARTRACAPVEIPQIVTFPIRTMFEELEAAPRTAAPGSLTVRERGTRRENPIAHTAETHQLCLVDTEGTAHGSTRALIERQPTVRRFLR